ncbi:MAG: GspH/FimT family pseudopilin [Pseudomonadota bacterium]
MDNLKAEDRRVSNIPYLDGSPSGATLIEMIAVLLILGILTAVVISRSINVQTIDNRVKTNRLHNHLRYAQSLALKQNAVRGVKSNGTGYWLFYNTDPDLTANRQTFPSESNATVDFADISNFTVFYDGYGRPFSSYTSADTNTAYTSPLSIQTGDLTSTLSPETGYVQ